MSASRRHRPSRRRSPGLRGLRLPGTGNRPRSGGRELRAPLPQRIGAQLRARRMGGRRARSARRAVSLALFVLAGALALVRPPSTAGSPVVVATRDIAVGTVLTADDLRAVDDPDPPDGAVAGAGEVVGRALTSAVRRGEVLTDARVVAPSGPAAGDGRVATPVRLADQDAVRLLSPGMHVALLRTDDGGHPARLTADAVVLIVPAPTPAGGLGSSSAAGDPRRLVVFGVPRADADAVALAALTGEVGFRFG